jgi:hypothetical protein
MIVSNQKIKNAMRNQRSTSRPSNRTTGAGSLGILSTLFEDLPRKDYEALRKTLQLFMDPKSDLKTDTEKLNQLESIIRDNC